MDRHHLTRLMDDPAVVRHEDIVDLKAMAERYPWFSGAHLLLAVGGHRQGDVLFDEQLRVSAAHLPNRSVLFDMIQMPLAEPTAPPPVIPDIPIEPIEKAPAVVEVPPTGVVLPIAVEVEEPTAESVIPLEDPLDKQIRAAIMANTYDLLLEHGPVEPSAPIAPMIAPVKPPDKLSFSAWLDLGDTPAQAPPAPGLVIDPLTLAPDAQDWLRNMPGANLAPTASATSDAEGTEALIERFVQQGPAARPAKKAEFYSPQQAAKRSLEDHADLVTETLARIYEKQGNSARAIAAYERLAQKYPERGEHFRALAKALEGH